MSKKNQHFKGQLSLDFQIPKEADRNFHLGGRSFYFFDLDDNIFFLQTPIALFHHKTGEEILLSSGEYAKEHKRIGKSGKYKNYEHIYNDEIGSFRFCRDHKDLSKQYFVADIEEALNLIDADWQAPSWSCFYHATYNHRPISIITARGHHPKTIEAGIKLIEEKGHLPHTPNYLSIFPVSHPLTRHQLGDPDLKLSVAELKRRSIIASVEKAISEYGYSPYHRFGMSDDDNKNIELITEAMRELKNKYPEMSFFVIETFKDSYAKYEVLLHETRVIVSQKESLGTQLPLFY